MNLMCFEIVSLKINSTHVHKKNAREEKKLVDNKTPSKYAFSYYCRFLHFNWFVQSIRLA